MITVSSLSQKPTGTKLYLDSSKDLIKCVVLKVKSSFRKLKTIKYHLENLKLRKLKTIKYYLDNLKL